MKSGIVCEAANVARKAFGKHVESAGRVEREEVREDEELEEEQEEEGSDRVVEGKEEVGDRDRDRMDSWGGDVCECSEYTGERGGSVGEKVEDKEVDEEEEDDTGKEEETVEYEGEGGE